MAVLLARGGRSNIKDTIKYVLHIELVIQKKHIHLPYLIVAYGCNHNPMYAITGQMYSLGAQPRFLSFPAQG